MPPDDDAMQRGPKCCGIALLSSPEQLPGDVTQIIEGGPELTIEFPGLRIDSREAVSARCGDGCSDQDAIDDDDA